MNAIIILINSIMDIYIFSLLAYVIASWLVSFKIVNPWQPFVRMILQSMGRLHEPLLSRIRSVLESAHAIAHAIKISKKMKKTESIVVTLSGRGDKDIDIVKEYMTKNVKNKRKI